MPKYLAICTIMTGFVALGWKLWSFKNFIKKEICVNKDDFQTGFIGTDPAKLCVLIKHELISHWQDYDDMHTFTFEKCTALDYVSIWSNVMACV